MCMYGRSLKRPFSTQRVPFNSTAWTMVLTITNPKSVSPAIFITKVSSSSVGSTPWQSCCLFRWCVMVLRCFWAHAPSVRIAFTSKKPPKTRHSRLRNEAQPRKNHNVDVDLYHFCPSSYQLHCKIFSTTCAAISSDNMRKTPPNFRNGLKTSTPQRPYWAASANSALPHDPRSRYHCP